MIDAELGGILDMALGQFRVQVIDKRTGAERWIDVTASSQEDARSKVAALGEIVGAAELVKLVEDHPPAPPAWAGGQHAGPAVSLGPSVPGAMLCPKCSRSQWSSSFQLFSIVIAVILFPLGLLALLMPRVHRCLACGYTYTGGPDPPTAEPPKTSSLLNIAVGLVIAFVLLGAVAAVIQGLHQSP